MSLTRVRHHATRLAALGLLLVGCGLGARGGVAMKAVGSAPAMPPAKLAPSKPASSAPAEPTKAESGAITWLLYQLRHRQLDPNQQTETFGNRWVTHTTRLNHESGTRVELIAHRGARLVLLDVFDDTALALVTAFEVADRSDEGDPLIPEQAFESPDFDDAVVVSLPRAALSREPVAVEAPQVRGDARDQSRTIYAAPDGMQGGVALRCGPVEILQDLRDNVQQLRQVNEGVELRGFTRVPLKWSWGGNSCQARFVRFRHEEYDEAAPAIPPGQVAVDAALGEQARRYLSRGKPLYQVGLRDDIGLQCEKVRYANGSLTKVIPTGKGRRRTEIDYSASFLGAGAIQLLGPGITDFDEQGRKGEGRAVGCMSYLHLVRETPDTLEVLPVQSLVAHHPDDVQRWYKTKGGCERAIAEHPRLRLEVGQRSLATGMPLRLGQGGC